MTAHDGTIGLVIRGDRQDMIQEQDEAISPLGSTAAARAAIYRGRWEALAWAREIAWQIIKYRMDHGLTQEELAARVGTSREQIARIESGRHLPSVTTLQRVADALGCRLAITFESGVDGAHRHEKSLAGRGHAASQAPSR